MQKSRQMTFEYFQNTIQKRQYGSTLKGRSIHGGSETKGKRKVSRPFARNKWIHLVLKSDKARGVYSFLRPQNKMMIEQTLRSKSKKFGVRIAQFVNVGNHLHLQVKASDKLHFQKFLKSVTCLIARQVTGAKKGQRFGRFWQGLAFTRLIRTQLEELQLGGYLRANQIQALRGQKARDSFLNQFNEWVLGLKRSTA